MIPVFVDAMADQAWTVKQNDSWLSIVDAGTGRGGSQVMLCAAENPSCEKRTGTVSIGMGKVTVAQDGTSDLSFKILPEVATASPLGAFGNVAVYATPDAIWTADSLADWIHISSGEVGAGNGNVKYVANANLDLMPRTGQIRFTPPAAVPDVDLYRGLLFWIKDQVNIEGNEERKTTYPLSQMFDGSFNNPLMGSPIPAFGAMGYAFGFSFRVGQLNCINRLVKIGEHSIYLNVGNRLVYQTVLTDCIVDKVDAYYTVVISVDAQHRLKIYAGERDGELACVCSNEEISGCMDFSSAKLMSDFVFGYCDKPSVGNLQSGQFGNIRFWVRPLTDRECECVDTAQGKMVDANPAAKIDESKYHYFPVTCNGFCTDEKHAVFMMSDKVRTAGWLPGVGRSRIRDQAMAGKSSSRFVIEDFGGLFDGSCVTNQSKAYSGNDGWNYYYDPITVTGNEDATYCFWIKLDQLPVEGDRAVIFERTMNDLPSNYKHKNYAYRIDPVYDKQPYLPGVLNHFGSTTNNFRLTLVITDEGRLRITQTSGKIDITKGEKYDTAAGSFDTYYTFVEDGVREDVLDGCVDVNEWLMITMVGKARKSISVYVNGREMGNVPTRMDFAWMPPIDMRHCMIQSMGFIAKHDFTLTVGGWVGSLDEMIFYDKALSAIEVESLYGKGLPSSCVYHTVAQGIIEPTLSVDSVFMSKGGGNANVSLSLAKGVNWSVTTSDEWLNVAGDTSGSGSAEFTIKVAANPTVVERVGTVTIAGKIVTVTQEGLKCEVECSTTVFGTSGDMGTIAVNPELGGSWTAKTDDDWIYIVSGESGTGSGDVWFITEGYDDTTGSRTGVITIGEEKVYITQRGFELSINPMVAEIGGNAGAGRIGVSADPNAVWAALAQDDWIEIVAGGEGVSDGTVVYRVTDNTTGQTRTGHINVSGQMYTITQTCTLKLTASVVGNGSVSGAGDYSQGKAVTLRAVPDAGNVFSHWSGDVVGNDEVTTIKMDSVKNVTATFIPEAAAQKLAEQKAAQGGFYTRDQIHALEMGNLVFDVDASGTARVGVQLMETSDLSNPNSWKPATLSANPDVGADGTVGMKVKAEGNAKFFKVVIPEK